MRPVYGIIYNGSRGMSQHRPCSSTLRADRTNQRELRVALKISVDTHGSVPVLKIAGRIEAREVDKLARRLAKVVQKGYPEIEIDLQATSFIDSSGLGILVFYHSQMSKENRQLTIANDGETNQYIERLLELTRLKEVLNCREVGKAHSR